MAAPSLAATSCKTKSIAAHSVLFDVNAFAEEFGDEAAAAFVVAAELPIIWERIFAPAELGVDEEARPEGCWSIDRGDERVKDFPPEYSL